MNWIKRKTQRFSKLTWMCIIFVSATVITGLYFPDYASVMLYLAGVYVGYVMRESLQFDAMFSDLKKVKEELDDALLRVKQPH